MGEAPEASHRYSFGDGELAVERLRVVARVFEPEIRAFLEREGPNQPALALDLGCGPGFSTQLVVDVLRPDITIGLDASRRFLARAHEDLGGRATFAACDVSQARLPIRAADLAFCHLLLTHLEHPGRALAAWTGQLATSGLLLVDEVAWIRTDHPVLAEYLDIVDRLIRANGGTLNVRDDLGRAATRHDLKVRTDRVLELPVAAADAATMFRLNIAIWRDDPFVRATYPATAIRALERQLDEVRRSAARDEITWGMRQVAYEASAD